MPRPGFTPALDLLEARSLLSTFTTCEYQHVRADIGRALAVADRTGNLQQASRLLSHAAAQVPFGRVSLLPLWKQQAASVADGADRSDVRRDLLLSLDRHLNRGVEVGAIQVKGPAARQIARPRVRALDDAIVVVNLTGEPLQVVVAEQPGGRKLVEEQLDNGVSDAIAIPMNGSSPLPLFYRVGAIDVNGPAVAEIDARVGQTVAFLRSPTGTGIVVVVYDSRFGRAG